MSRETRPEIYGDENAESFVVGTCLVYPNEFDTVSEILPDGDMFINATLGTVYDTALTVYNRNGGRLDTAMLIGELQRRGVEDADALWLQDLMGSHGFTGNLDIHAKRVRDCWQVRRAYASLGDASFRIKRDPEAVGQILSDAMDDLTGIASSENENAVHQVGRVAEQIEARIMSGKRDDVIPTGFRTIDGWLRGGIRPGEIMVIGGRPGQGKTALGVNMAMLTAEQGNPAAILSIEMSETEIVRRMMAFYRCPMNATSAQRQDIENARERLQALPLSVVDMPKGELSQIRSHIRTMSRRDGVRFFVLDYLQLVRAGREGVEEYQRVTIASQTMKQIAREYGVALVVLAQVNRDGGTREKPTMNDLQGSGTIEQDADQIVLVHNPPNSDEEPELILAKHRNGRTGTVDAIYRAAHTAFKDRGEKVFTEKKDSTW